MIRLDSIRLVSKNFDSVWFDLIRLFHKRIFCFILIAYSFTRGQDQKREELGMRFHTHLFERLTWYRIDEDEPENQWVCQSMHEMKRHGWRICLNWEWLEFKHENYQRCIVVIEICWYSRLYFLYTVRFKLEQRRSDLSTMCTKCEEEKRGREESEE